MFSLLANSEQTFLIRDALDECSEREKLIDVISQILKNSAVNLLMMSRKKKFILKGLQGVVDIEIDLETIEIHGIDADIDLHVRKCLESDVQLKKWNTPIKKEILEALVEGAHGM